MASTEARPAGFVGLMAQTPGVEKVTTLVDEKDDAKIDVGSVAEEDIDLYVPLKLDGSVTHRDNPLTARAVLVGIILGCLVNASNLYLGLKTGFTFPASMFGAIFGYGIVNILSKTFGNVPILGGSFGPQENSIIQAAATGAGGIAGIFVAGIPAMYQLKTIEMTPKDSYGSLITITLVGRELKLLFPTPTAVALTIKSMHAGVAGAREALSKLKALALAFFASLVQRVASYYAVGILYDWHFFTWIHIWSGYTSWAMHIESWGWWFEWTPAFIGSGILIGMNSALSMFGGAVIAWAIIGPILVAIGECIGAPQWDETTPEWHGYYSYAKLSNLGHETPSPRYWLLWPGVMMMVCTSMAELVVQYKVIGHACKTVWHKSCVTINDILVKRGKHSRYFSEKAANEIKGVENMVPDPARPEDQVQIWMWSSGLILTIVGAILIFHYQWGMTAGLTILACVLGFMFSFLAIQIGAVTDQTPLTAASKASQLVLGGVTSGQGLAIKDAQRINLVAGGLASGGADVAMTLTSDFRTGFLLGTPPIKQWYAQALGTLISVFLAPGMFVLFTSAYPCILDGEAEHCAFGVPSVAA
ncbi:hypothetical protein DL764_009122 [Monosporascus ibericus]|uniref:Oligopeptide transporter n=1 Tax=Monosporascus ibericus TaxID=155417 RepID=A0A4Q4SYQ0_9PEZI|nr:hypothetical protein DL764_009122 [Monosporascus ibericus]